MNKNSFVYRTYVCFLFLLTLFHLFQAYTTDCMHAAHDAKNKTAIWTNTSAFVSEECPDTFESQFGKYEYKFA